MGPGKKVIKVIKKLNALYSVITEEERQNVLKTQNALKTQKSGMPKTQNSLKTRQKVFLESNRDLFMDGYFSRVLKTELFLDSKVIGIQKRPNF